MNEQTSPSLAEPRRAPRLVLVWIALPVLAVLLVYLGNRLVSNPVALGLADYIAYWSAGHVSARGGHPYDIDELARLQYDTGWRRDDAMVTDQGLPWPNVMYYPPWTLPLVIPFGLVPYGLSRLLWLVFHLLLCLGCADALWVFYGGPARYRWIAWVVAFSFLPTLISLRMGQITPVILLGAVAFLVCERRRFDWLAGAACVLLVIKPHLTYLFAVALLLWAVERRRWAVLAGAVLTGLVCTAIPLLLDPHLLQGYFDTSTRNPPAQNKCPTVSTLLRLLIDERAVWLSFVPTALGLAWFLGYYWWKHRKTWDWSEQLSIVVFVSFLTTSYGAWSFDLVVLLVPLVHMAVWLWFNPERPTVIAALGIYVLMDALALTINLIGADYVWFFWMTPLLLVGYLLLRSQVGRKAENAAVLVG